MIFSLIFLFMKTLDKKGFFLGEKIFPKAGGEAGSEKKEKRRGEARKKIPPSELGGIKSNEEKPSKESVFPSLTESPFGETPGGIWR